MFLPDVLSEDEPSPTDPGDFPATDSVIGFGYSSRRNQKGESEFTCE